MPSAKREFITNAWRKINNKPYGVNYTTSTYDAMNFNAYNPTTNMDTSGYVVERTVKLPDASSKWMTGCVETVQRDSYAEREEQQRARLAQQRQEAEERQRLQAAQEQQAREERRRSQIAAQQQAEAHKQQEHARWMAREKARTEREKKATEEEREKAARLQVREREAPAESVRHLRSLIREKYRLDLLVWSERGAQVGDRDLIEVDYM